MSRASPEPGETTTSLEELRPEHRAALEAVDVAQRSGAARWRRDRGGARYLELDDGTMFVPTGHDSALQGASWRARIGGLAVFLGLDALVGAFYVWDGRDRSLGLALIAIGVVLGAFGVVVLRSGNRADAADSGPVVLVQGIHLLTDALLVRGGGDASTFCKVYPRERVVGFGWRRGAGRTSECVLVFRDAAGDEQTHHASPYDVRALLSRWLERRG